MVLTVITRLLVAMGYLYIAACAWWGIASSRARPVRRLLALACACWGVWYLLFGLGVVSFDHSINRLFHVPLIVALAYIVRDYRVSR